MTNQQAANAIAPWLSILIPAYNAELYVEECLASILPQLGEDRVEIIVVEDRSTDATADILDRLAAAAPELIHVEHFAANRGVSAVRNRLLDLARGDYIWFVDADDRMKRGAMDALREIVARERPDLVFCDFSVLRETYTERQLRKGDLHKTVLAAPARTILSDPSAVVEGVFKAGELHLWSKIGRRELFAGLRFPEGRHFEDVAISPVIAARSKRSYYEPTPWMEYRQSETSILATMTPTKYIELMQALADVNGQFLAMDGHLSDAAWFEFRAFCSRHFIGCAKNQLISEPTSQSPAVLKICHDHLRSILGAGNGWMAWQSLRRGQFSQWMRFRKWERRAMKRIGNAGR